MVYLGKFRLAHNPALALRTHGWPMLEPFSHDNGGLRWLAALPASGPQSLSIRVNEQTRYIRLYAHTKLPAEDVDSAKDSVRRMFRHDEDFSDFWRLCIGHPVLRRCIRLKAGALIRSATVFEDVLKTFCTVNCRWQNTINMVSRLCKTLGKGSAFPTVGAVAKASPKKLENMGLGYRAHYIGTFSRQVLDGTLRIDGWPSQDDPAALKEQLLAIEGIGPYAANHMLMLLGHYDFVPCDSDVCAYLKLPAGTTARKLEQAIEARYASWGKYAFLAYKFERLLKRKEFLAR